MPKEGDQMSEENRRMVAAISEATAQAVTARLIDAMDNDETVDRIVSRWSGSMDRTIGRGLRRALWYVLIALGGIAATKLGMWDKLVAFLKP